MKTKSGEKVNIKGNFKEYLSYLKKYKFMIVCLLILVLIHEVKQIADRYIFKIIVDKGSDFVAGKIGVEVISKTFLIAGIVYCVITLFNLLVNWIKLHLINRLDANTIYDLKKKYFSCILGLDYSFHTTHKTGSLISRMTRGSSAMEKMNDSIMFNFAPLLLQFIAAVITLIYLDKLSALIIFVVMISFFLFSYLTQKGAEDSNLSLNRTEDIEKGNTVDFFTNMESIKNYGKEEYIKKKYLLLTAKTKENQIKFWDYLRVMSVGQSFILAAGTFLLLYFPIIQFLHGEISLGTLTFIYTTYLGLIGPMFGFVHGMRDFSRSMADFQELFAYGKFNNEVKDKPNAKKLVIKEGKIEFKDVSFNYGKRKIFENFNLKINPNEKVAFVGHSGSGKTTLIKLLYRLYNLDKGKILIDNKDISEFKQNSLRSELSIVPQECILFDDSIFNNIKFSRPEASKQEVMEAIKFAQLDRVIKNFPDKEDTVVGERGVKLSGGEKQRVSIARAILADKQILVLDEATSSLDSETEHEIQKDLVNLLHGRTSIIIAHRLSTIMNADKIVVLKNGKIVQIGKHEELIKEKGEYRQLWNMQKGGYIK